MTATNKLIICPTDNDEKCLRQSPRNVRTFKRKKSCSTTLILKWSINKAVLPSVHVYTKSTSDLNQWGLYSKSVEITELSKKISSPVTAAQTVKILNYTHVGLQTLFSKKHVKFFLPKMSKECRMRWSMGKRRWCRKMFLFQNLLIVDHIWHSNCLYTPSWFLAKLHR